MAIRHALDTEVALITATTLHTLGAIGVIVGLGLHIALLRRFRDGGASGALEASSFWVIWNAVWMNLIGGFMRTYLPGHPTIVDTAASPWVQVMLLKHVFIFAALGALVFLHHVVVPMARRAGTDGARVAWRPHALGVIVVVTGVVGASVLGALAQITPLGEGFDDEEPHRGDVIIIQVGEGFVRYENATGRLTSLPPLRPDQASGAFFVPDGAVTMNATLTYDETPSQMRLVLVPPMGSDLAIEGAAGRADIDVEEPAIGTWSYRVETIGPTVDAAWSLTVRTASVALDGLYETVRIDPDTFFEINTKMPEGGTIEWAWTTDGAVVAFDVHSHFDGVVEYYVEETTDQHSGAFTNDRAGGYSLLWANDGDAPVVLTYVVWGDFEVDSYFPPR